jgi:hypothetical protein
MSDLAPIGAELESTPFIGFEVASMTLIGTNVEVLSG